MKIKVIVISSIGERIGQRISYILMSEVKMFENILKNSLILYSKAKIHIKWDIGIVFQFIHIKEETWTRMIYKKKKYHENNPIVHFCGKGQINSDIVTQKI